MQWAVAQLPNLYPTLPHNWPLGLWFPSLPPSAPTPTSVSTQPESTGCSKSVSSNFPIEQWALHVWSSASVNTINPRSEIFEKHTEISKKQSLNLPHTSKHLHSIHIVLDTISNLEMCVSYIHHFIYRTWASPGFCFPRESWNQYLTETQGQLPKVFINKEVKKVSFLLHSYLPLSAWV